MNTPADKMPAPRGRRIHYLVLVLVGLVVAVLIYSLLRIGTPGAGAGAGQAAASTGGEAMRPCPLCHTMLRRGERVHTVVYSGSSSENRPRPGEVRDAVTHMFGCPYCKPGSASAGANARICPVCRGTLPVDGYVIARMFERDTRKHVHVLGCTECRSGHRRGGVQ